ncbi:hypothetical protein VCO01S_10120 [Vibrio comitans NBRC 102076]|uniref:Uncharacterized protein n=1 Tax=Vibrio comitans NBRC 102076 TaxID=1219078 RepID=A0A4Y3IJY1_9VIBR|nr:hypothetical protein VCO01S_10120 [Vibrio comitans NBRC 102076]
MLLTDKHLYFIACLECAKLRLTDSIKAQKRYREAQAEKAPNRKILPTTGMVGHFGVPGKKRWLC